MATCERSRATDARSRGTAAVVAVLAVFGVLAWAAEAPLAGQQQPRKQEKTWKTAWGDPDLQGSWSNSTTTPLQRPDRFKDREFLTPEEQRELDQQTDLGTDERGATPQQDVGGAYNRFWWDRGYSDGRTSQIVDPPDGRVPMKPEAEQGQRDVRRQQADTSEFGSGGRADSWEDRNQYERCIIRAPLPRVPTGYDNNYQIVQSPGVVAILQEQIHETRVIPLDGRPHLDPSVRQWLGDSRGHWEGATLVVETTNFSDRTNFQGAGRNMHLVERWTRVADDRIEYRFTVEDPTVWTRPWTAGLSWNRVGMLYEYACHEGNQGLYNILNGARVQEAERAQKK